MSEWSLSVSMMRDPWRTGIDRVVALRDDASFSEVNTRAVVLWIDAGIVAIPLFKIDIPSSSECVGFGSKYSRMETDHQVETGKLFGPMCLSTREDFGHWKVFQIPMIGDHIDRKSRAFKVMLPSFESFKNCE